MRRRIESGARRGDRFLQIGLRGYRPGAETLTRMAGQRQRRPGVGYLPRSVPAAGNRPAVTSSTRSAR
jgi:hypothetical protein